MFSNRYVKERAFTLIELLVVILVVAILLIVAAPSFLGQSDKARDSQVKQYLAYAQKNAKITLSENEGSFPKAKLVADGGVAITTAGTSGDNTSVEASPASSTRKTTLIGQLAGNEPELFFVDTTAGVSKAIPSQVVVDRVSDTIAVFAARSTSSRIFCLTDIEKEQTINGINYVPGLHFSHSDKNASSFVCGSANTTGPTPSPAGTNPSTPGTTPGNPSGTPGNPGAPGNTGGTPGNPGSTGTIPGPITEPPTTAVVCMTDCPTPPSNTTTPSDGGNSSVPPVTDQAGSSTGEWMLRMNNVSTSSCDASCMSLRTAYPSASPAVTKELENFRLLMGYEKNLCSNIEYAVLIPGRTDTLKYYATYYYTFNNVTYPFYRRLLLTDSISSSTMICKLPGNIARDPYTYRIDSPTWVYHYNNSYLNLFITENNRAHNCEVQTMYDNLQGPSPITRQPYYVPDNYNGCQGYMTTMDRLPLGPVEHNVNVDYAHGGELEVVQSTLNHLNWNANQLAIALNSGKFPNLVAFINSHS